MTKLSAVLLLIGFLLQPSAAFAQDQSADHPYYIVQSGDNLNAIAYLFNVSPVDLADANGITDPDQIYPGEKIIIPGLSGVSGILQSVVVPYGQSLLSLSREYDIPIDTLIKLNRITSPMELYAGSNMIIPQPGESNSSISSQIIIRDGESLLDAAASMGMNPWTLALENNLRGSWQVLPMQTVYYQDTNQIGIEEMINPMITRIDINPLPMVQGNTEFIKIKTKTPALLEGSLGDYSLQFIQDGDNNYIALQGVHAMLDPGLYPLRFFGTFQDNTRFDFQQYVLIKSGYFPNDPELTVPPETMDPAVTVPEEDQVEAIVKPVSTTILWSGQFRYPVDEPICVKSGFGNRRSYNGSGYIYYHTGIDFGVCANLNIYTPADGIVVFTGFLTVRGNTTIIDHGWGVYSGIYHQSKILVNVGDKVTAGEKIREIGATGRVNGPHLHWDLFVNGIQVSPWDWLENSYP